MSFLSNLSIRLKLMSVVVIGVVGMLVTLAFNYNITRNNHLGLDRVQVSYYPILERADANRVRLAQIKESLSNAVLMGDKNMLSQVAGIARSMDETFSEMKAMEVAPTDRIDRLKELFHEYYDSALTLSKGLLDETIDRGQAKSLSERVNASQVKLDQAFSTFREESYRQFTQALDAVNQSSTMALNTGLGIGLITTLILVLSGLFVSGSITRNIGNVVASLEAMANGNGDLTLRLKSEANDEVGTLVDCFNRFVEKLQGVITSVAGTTTQVATASEEMKRMSEKSATNMSNQQREIDQVVTAMAEMTGTVEEVAGSAARASEAANLALAEADSGKQVVGENMEAISNLAADVEHAAEVIQDLNSHSDAIGAVLNVIRDIAEQTNLLALNAAIEAARAGEQGRGFAVVADEVRTLATRTHESTREINDMISRLQSGTQVAVETMTQGCERAQASVEQAARVREALERIAQAVEQISGMNLQIASAAEEQAAAVKEININIVNLGNVVGQVNEGAHVAEEDSEELTTLASQLKSQVQLFKI